MWTWRSLLEEGGALETLAGVVGHILVSDLADHLSGALMHVCNACARSVVSRSIPLYVDSAIALGGFNAANAASVSQSGPAGSDRASTATEPVVAGRGIDQHHFAGI